jgi:3-mercaptopyruvate sulfurtransferase SseA
MIDYEFEVCFALPLSVMLAKRRMKRVPVRIAYCQSHIPGAQKIKITPPQKNI